MVPICLAYQSGSKANTKPYTNSRPSFRKGVVEEVWENAKGPDGLVRDPNTGEVINWTPGESRKGVWDMGHIVLLETTQQLSGQGVRTTSYTY